MTPGAVAWLPHDALADARTAEPVAHAIAEWSDDWLAGAGLVTPCRWEARGTAFPLAGYSEIHRAGSWRLAKRQDSELELASLLLGREVGEHNCRTRHDRAVIDHLAAKALKALAIKIGEVFRDDIAAAEGEWFDLPITGIDGNGLLRLEANREALVSLAKSWASPPRRPGPLSSHRGSLAQQTIRLGARIGRTSLPLAELDALGVGDVLVLDTPLSEAVDARIDDASAGRAALSLVAADDCFQLKIERPASQW